MLLFFSKPAQGVKSLIDDSFPCPWSAEICCVSVHSFRYCGGSRTERLLCTVESLQEGIEKG